MIEPMVVFFTYFNDLIKSDIKIPTFNLLVIKAKIFLAYSSTKQAFQDEVNAGIRAEIMLEVNVKVQNLSNIISNMLRYLCKHANFPLYNINSNVV